MSIANACAMYGVTQEQCQEAELPCQWRSAYGNSYAVVKVSDILALKKKLAQQKQEEEKQELIAKHGEEEYERMKKEKEECKTAEAEAAKAAQNAKHEQQKLVEQVTKLLSLFKDDGSIGDMPDIDTVKLSKSAAKSDFFLNDSDFDVLKGETVGRITKYNAYDVIERAEHSSKHCGYNKKSLLEKIQSNPLMSRISNYAGYLKKKIDDDKKRLPKEIVDGAMEQVQVKLQKEVEESEAKVKDAEQELKSKNGKVRSFNDVFGEEDDTKPAPKKKKARKAVA